MNWLYWNYIINSWNYLKENWNYLKENWNDLDYKSKRCVYFMLFIFFSVFSAPTLFTLVLPKLYNLSNSKKYFGFDTFSGYPKEVLNKNPDFVKNNSDIFETVNLRLINEKLKDECKIIKGNLPKSLKDFLESKDKFRKEYLKISIVYIDCNDYKTAIECLDVLYPYFSKGCIIAVDENTIGGETKALEEFCSKKNLIFKNGDFNGIISSYAKN